MKQAIYPALTGLLLLGCAAAVPLTAGNPGTVAALEGLWRGRLIFNDGGSQVIELRRVSVSETKVWGEIVRYPLSGALTDALDARLENGELRGRGSWEGFQFSLKMYGSGSDTRTLWGPFSLIRGRAGTMSLSKQR